MYLSGSKGDTIQSLIWVYYYLLVDALQSCKQFFSLVGLFFWSVLMRGSRNFHQGGGGGGGGPGQSDKKALIFFFIPQLIFQKSNNG